MSLASGAFEDLTMGKLYGGNVWEGCMEETRFVCDLSEICMADCMGICLRSVS